MHYKLIFAMPEEEVAATLPVVQHTTQEAPLLVTAALGTAACRCAEDRLLGRDTSARLRVPAPLGAAFCIELSSTYRTSAE